MPPEDGGAIRGSLPTVRNDRLCAGSESTLETEETKGGEDRLRRGPHPALRATFPVRGEGFLFIRTRGRAFYTDFLPANIGTEEREG